MINVLHVHVNKYKSPKYREVTGISNQKLLDTKAKWNFTFSWLLLENKQNITALWLFLYFILCKTFTGMSTQRLMILDNTK